MSQTVQRYRNRLRLRRDWMNPFSWFDWFFTTKPRVLFRYDTGSGRETGAETFTRASTATYVDSAGVVQTAASGVKRDRHYINGQGPYLLLEGARTNKCLQSEDFNTTWTAAAGTPTCTTGAATLGDLSLCLIGDDNAAGIEGFNQPISFTGDATKALSFFFAQGTATSTSFRINDATAGQNRAIGAITWSGTTPVLTMTTGTNLVGGTACRPMGVCSAGVQVWRAEILTTTVTAANTNNLQFYPANTVAGDATLTGNIYVGGVMAED